MFMGMGSLFSSMALNNLLDSISSLSQAKDLISKVRLTPTAKLTEELVINSFTALKANLVALASTLCNADA